MNEFLENNMNLKPFENNSMSSYYKQHRELAKYKNVPIQYLDEVKALLYKKGEKFRIRYRGPRTCFSDIRPRNQRMQDCLKEFANRFTVYYR
jgi:uncharacterized protein YaaR (DUF327 family)